MAYPSALAPSSTAGPTSASPALGVSVHACVPARQNVVPGGLASMSACPRVIATPAQLGAGAGTGTVVVVVVVGAASGIVVVDGAGRVVVVTMVVVVDVVVAVEWWRDDAVRVRLRAPAPETPLRMTSAETTSAMKCPRCMRRVPFSRHRE